MSGQPRLCLNKPHLFPAKVERNPKSSEEGMTCTERATASERNLAAAPEYMDFRVAGLKRYDIDYIQHRRNSGAEACI